MKTMFRCFCLAGLSLAVLGCGSDPAYKGDSRVPLSGRVTLDGDPIDGGTITFIPADGKQRVAGGSIVNGMYSIPEEKGANQGVYRIEIRWPKPNGKKLPDSDTGEMKDEVTEAVPPKFNTQSSLTATISAKEANPLDFDLKSK
jgi:hypothetical protein